MRVDSVTYGRTYSKNFQSLRVEVTIDLDAPTDTHETALDLAKALVNERIEREKDGI